ncbi:FYVE, RhoGEF and PH domain-containing protein 2-like [Ornithodoros turicata]|uniref:FYVE, RhoGEF and PH domain-containing protein 2-like n=1 Tax=Ornithodoros turicata TaxID=34597 RepID=UPI003139364C
MAQPSVPTLCSHDSIASSESPKRCCTLRRRSSSPPPLSPSFSFNGRQLCPLSRDSTLEDCSAVRLVGFHKRGSLVVVDPAPPSNGTNMEDTQPASAEDTAAPDQLRQDQLNALLQQTQDAIRVADSCSSPSSSSAPLTNPPSSEIYRRMEGDDLQRFVQEANMRCSNSSHEQFVDFVRTNRQAFAQLLEETASMFNGTLKLPTSSFGDRDSGIFTDHDSWNCGAATSGGESRTSSGATTRQQFVFPSDSPSIFRVVNGSSSSETNLRTSESVSVTASVRSGDTDPALHFNTHPLVRRTDNGTTSRGPDSVDGATERNARTLLDMGDLFRRSPLFERTHNLFRASGMSDVMSASDTQLRAKPRPFSDFERLSDASLRSDPEGLNILGRMSSSFHFSTRSHFEYCGETNTFRFSTQQMCESLSGSYESVSESEDEEESLEDATSLGEEAKILAIEDVPASRVDDSIDTVSACSLSIGTPSITSSRRLEKPTTGVAASSWGRVAQELLTTEKTYVEVLHLLDQVFAFRVDQENRAHSMFPQAVVSAMFSNLKSLYQLHHDFLLPKLQGRIDTWDSNPRIGDIMKDFAPFLKMYTEYVRNYDDAMRLLGSWYNKQPRFQGIMDDIHRMPECGNLTIQHHMLTPVQRVPRYQLLLKEYLKKLPEDSPDTTDTEKALELVSTAAIHSNEAMKKIDKFKKLLEIQDLVGGVMDLVSPTRELLREGKITKICARSGDHQERHMFVFNDLVLLCSQRLMSNRVVSGACYRIRARVDMDGLIVQEGDNLETPNSFYIKNTGRSIELFAQTPEEKMSWMQTLAKAVHDLKMRKSSLRVGLSGSKSPEELELGQRAPVLVKADTVSHCQKCSMAFSALGLRWKHHCHACGIVACSKCLSRKTKLAYDNNRASRVCSSCWEAILKNHPDRADAEREIKSPLESPTFQAENAVISGYLKLKTGGQDKSSKAWARRWFALQRDFVLYSFKSHEDFLPLTSMPVPGFLVSIAEKGDGVDLRLPIFKLFHQKKTYFFQASDVEELERWTKALEKASRAEDPG